ncbi:signal peptide peptidase SppA [Granulicella aggregans]|uniref:Signal peptide peptidase SppA n=1 Tax=Granulicella aggregans TaxID=474949 RepID=A0A7W7ZFY2_9BACT|nr:S49 family peptidase [Granulicella aggregans]MBB5059092.1 signal peptide peptidase SppA [Granulicella aggregans]
MRNQGTTLWAIRPEATLTVIQLLSRDKAGSQPLGIGNVEMLGTKWEASKPSIQGKPANKIAVIPIQGVLTNDGPAYFGSNYQTIGEAVEKAMRDPDVKRIVLAVDSPGGEVTGLPETAAIIAAAARVKPVSAIVEGSAASAAYWLASQASDITLTPSGEVGSVGVRMMHVDTSKMLDDMGVKITELQSGKFKTEWSPYKPLSEEAQADMQTRLDATHRDFLDAVSSGRGRRVSTVISQNQFGGGRMFSAEDAKRHGLVDRLGSPRQFYRGLSAPSTSGAMTPGMARVALARMRMDILKNSPSFR